MKILGRNRYWLIDLFEKMLTNPDLAQKEIEKLETLKPELGHKLHNLDFLLHFSYIRRAYFEEVIGKINFQALQYALHNYSIKTEVTSKDDFFDSLITAMNMLGEELSYSTITRQYLNDVFNAIPDMVFVLDEKGFIQSFNQSVKNELLFTEEELQFSSISNYFHENFDLIELQQAVRKQQIVHLISKDKKRIPVSVRSSKFVRGNQNELGWIFVFSNVSSLEKYKEQLEHALAKAQESERLKSAFLANISHEIRTPMNGIMGFAELLSYENITKEEQKQYVDIINKSGQRLLSIINDLIDISKIEAGIMKVTYQQFNMNEAVHDLYLFFKPETEAKGLKFSVELPLVDSLAEIETDKGKFQAILSNLIKNSIKFTSKGSIEVGYNLKPNAIEFYVKDTGTGIPANRQKAIFDRFVQADIEDKKAMQGAGLGLSIAKAYTELLDGEIWLESEYGAGTTFYFTLPISKLNIEHYQISSGEKKLKPLKMLKIIVAEDDISSAALLKHIINEFASQIIFAKSGVEAIECFQNHPDTDLILMDIKMPEMSGLEATREIRKISNEVIIIAQTAYALSGDKEKAMDAGFNDFLTKPVLREVLLESLQKYFSKTN